MLNILIHFSLTLNEQRGLLDKSEENLEKMHKVARRIREKKCRLTGPEENLTDLINRSVLCSYKYHLCILVPHCILISSLGVFSC